jgi:hypothetical protein
MSSSQQKLDDLIQKHQQASRSGVLPERDLWPGIEQAILTVNNSSNKYFANKHFAVAASLMLAVFIGYFSFESGKAAQGDALVAALSEQHQSQKQSLLVQYQDSPALTSNWNEQLDELDDAAAAIKAALKEDPNNPALIKMLRHVYSQQMQIIERVHKPTWSQI